MNFSILSENRSNSSVRYRNYYYTHTQKTADKVSAEDEEEEYESHHTDGEKYDEKIVTTEILNVANAKEAEVIDDGKFACDICEKRYKANGLNTC
jgi:hypothetical protein